ncbi:MAG: flagellar motor protein MotA [Alphaproteobacteria bacterium]
MTRPVRYLLRMAVFLAVVGTVAVFLHEQLVQAFRNAPVLNSIIVAVLLLGVAENIRQVLILNPEVAWIRGFQAEAHIPGSTLRRIRLLAPMAAMLGERRSGRLQLSATATRAVLDGISSRLEESRDLSRYLVGLLIFLGLLGTFWGLLETVSAVSGVIAGLSGSTDVSSLFNDLQAGLKAPLSGMGTAFGTSLFGLAGSLVVGFLDLQSGQAQNRFYNELEEWLSGVTRLGGGGPVGDGDQSVPAYIQALLEQTADNLENFQRTVQQAEQGRQGANAALVTLGERMTQLTDEMRAEREVVARLAEAQLELRPALQRFVEAASRGGAGTGDEALRASLRGIESSLSRLLEENQAGRAQLTQDLRNEFRLLARTIAALADDQR